MKNILLSMLMLLSLIFRKEFNHLKEESLQKFRVFSLWFKNCSSNVTTHIYRL